MNIQSLTSPYYATNTFVKTKGKSRWTAFNRLLFLSNFLFVSVTQRWCPPGVLNYGLASLPLQIILALPLETDPQLTANCFQILPACGPAVEGGDRDKLMFCFTSTSPSPPAPTFHSTSDSHSPSSPDFFPSNLILFSL